MRGSRQSTCQSASQTAARSRAAAVALATVLALATPAQALEIVLDDVAPDRVERQRHFARAELPLAGTPQLAEIDDRLKAKALARGRPIYIRIFKAESELELWMQNQGGTFTRLATYPICHWTGTLGPKLKEGDKQSPEGFYSVGWGQTRLVGRWRRAFNLGFPNQHDQALNRTGSYILIHGGCSSVGCFAMTDPVQEEIYGLADAALAAGQKRFQVHVFPFRMTPENLSRYSGSEWVHTWADLKPAYDSFERTHIPPAIALCGPRYKIADGLPGETGSPDTRLIGLKPLPADGGPRDLTTVLDTQGRWLPPACEFDDEARRKPQDIATPLPTLGPVTSLPLAAVNAVTLSSSPAAGSGPGLPEASLAAPAPATAVETQKHASSAPTHSGHRVSRPASARGEARQDDESVRSRFRAQGG